VMTATSKMQQKFLVLTSFAFQSLKEDWMIFVMWKHRWRWKFFAFVSTTGFTVYNLLYRMMLDAQFKRLTLEEDDVCVK
jgi:hypothetical protein